MRRSRRGAALIIAMFFVVLFAALAVALSQMAGVNVESASNQQAGNRALANAQSGLETVRYWLSGLSVPGTVDPANRLSSITASLQAKLSYAGASANIKAAFDGTKTTIAPVYLASGGSDWFSAVITQPAADSVILKITGTSGQVSRTIQVAYDFVKRGHSVFDYGVATKGPLSVQGNVDLSGVNVDVEASVYIESKSQNLALDLIGSSSIAGDVSIVNPTGFAHLQGNCSIAGLRGYAAQTHVHIGVPEADFPIPSVSQFSQYVTTTIDSTSQTSNVTYTNARILANTNPSFSGNVNFNGLLLIEQPNTVSFTGNTNITGIVVAAGSLDNPLAQNVLNFQGNVGSTPVTALPDTADFSGIRKETGSFIVAPGFKVNFTGSFSTLNGVIAASGVTFGGNAGGQIKGSIINYDAEAMTLTGSTDLRFNRSGTAQNPAGFMPEMMLNFKSGSYTEIME